MESEKRGLKVKHSQSGLCCCEVSGGVNPKPMSTKVYSVSEDHFNMMVRLAKLFVLANPYPKGKQDV